MILKKAVFPVAGLGTRFLPVTKAIPKEMLSLVDKPLIQYVVEEAKESGLEEVIFVTGMGKSAIEDHFDTSVGLELLLKERGKGEALQTIRDISSLIHFSYTRQKMPLGLGDAVLCAKNLIGDEPFAVLLGDDIIDSAVPAIKQMMEIFGRYKGSVMAVEEVPESQAHQYGIIKAREIEPRVYKVEGLVEKPVSNPPSNLAIIGRYILRPEIFRMLESTAPGKGGEVQLTDAINRLTAEQPVFAYKVEGKRYDAGDKLGFLKASVCLALKRPDLKNQFREFLRTVV